MGYANNRYEEKDIEADGIRRCASAYRIPMTSAPTWVCNRRAWEWCLGWDRYFSKHEIRQDWDT